jgi:hypothetical protein
MTATSLLIERSFADAIAIIAKADELPEQTRRHWATSLRQIAKALDKPLEVIPCRYSAIRGAAPNITAHLAVRSPSESTRPLDYG